MKAIICDKCKKIIENEELSETTSLHFLNYGGAKYIEMDLCDECCGEIVNFIEESEEKEV